MAFREIDPKSIPDNLFKLIGDDWMLLSAACGKDFNTMTASWATAGVLWNKPVVQANSPLTILRNWSSAAWFCVTGQNLPLWIIWQPSFRMLGRC